MPFHLKEKESGADFTPLLYRQSAFPTTAPIIPPTTSPTGIAAGCGNLDANAIPIALPFLAPDILKSTSILMGAPLSG